MQFSWNYRFPTLGASLLSALISGCVFIGDYDDSHHPATKAITYETCYYDSECFAGEVCEELAVPAGPYTDYVNAICTFQCFDDLDCPRSDFNRLPGACIDHAILGGPHMSRICVERCELDVDCDVAAGFGCERVAGDRICVPVL